MPLDSGAIADGMSTGHSPGRSPIQFDFFYDHFGQPCQRPRGGKRHDPVQLGWGEWRDLPGFRGGVQHGLCAFL